MNSFITLEIRHRVAGPVIALGERVRSLARIVARFLGPVCTPRRVRTYPRITLVVLAVAVVLNVAGCTGWRGANGQLLFHDFIVFYSAGTLFQTAPHSLYDFAEQLSLQRSLIAPTPMDGTGPFSHRPMSRRCSRL